MGKKQLFINIFANALSFVTSLLIAFVLTPYLISTIGKEIYAFYPISNNFISYLAIITTALNSMASRFVTIELVKKNIDGVRKYYSSIFISNILISFLLMIPMAILIVLLESILNVPLESVKEVKLLFLLVFISMIINVITSVFSISTFAKNRLDWRSGGEIFQSFLKLSLYMLLFTIFEPSIVYVGIVAIILSITNLFIQIFFSKILLPDIKISLKNFDFSAVKQLFSSGIWNSINSLGSILLLSVALLLANVFLGPSAAGELSIVQILPAFVSSVISVLINVFMPRFTHLYAGGSQSNLIDEVHFSQKLIGIIATTPIIIVLVFGQNFFELWVPTENSKRLHTLSIISILPLVIHANMWTVYGVNIVLNKIKLPSLVLIGAGALNVIVVLCLLNTFKVDIFIIPIVSSVISIIYYFFFIPRYASSLLKINKSAFQVHIIKAMIFVSVFTFISNLIVKEIVIDNWLKLSFMVVVVGIVGIAVNSIFVLKYKEFINVKNLLARTIKSKRKKEF